MATMNRMRARTFIVLLIALGAALLAAGPATGLSRALANQLFGPQLVRAEVILKDATGVHAYRGDRGRVRGVSATTLTLVERDGAVVTIPVAADADVRWNGRPVALTRLRRNLWVETIREGDAPARTVRATGRMRNLSLAPVFYGPRMVRAQVIVRNARGVHDYRLVGVRSGGEALAELARHGIRMVVLDIGLPGMDGFEVCRRIRARSAVPIVMLTARDEEPDRVAGLELGADDYVPKPFSPRELAARIKAILRRSEGGGEADVLTLGDVEVRRHAHEATVAGEGVELTGKEFDLLTFLLEHPGIVFTREQLLDRVWGMTYAGGTRTVDVHVAQLRRKLGRPELVRTVRGSGYKSVRP